MTRKPLFWILFALASAGCAAFTWAYFAEAFPIVALDLQMDRASALAAARQLADEHGWGPEGFRQAASFGVDSEVQSFVELEAGGTEAFRELIEGDLYAPYKWQVRHFKPGETTETRVFFTPAGDPYGFTVTLPEDQPGAALSAEEAKAVAEREAVAWHADLDAYRLIEQSQEVRPGGRVDHTLVYERPDVTLGAGKFRLRLVVAGDGLTACTRSVHVPEAFTRRYEAMRSANNAIGSGGLVGMVFLVLGAAVGLFYLLRERWVLWRMPLRWGVAVSTVVAAASLNTLPLQWMSYDTALSPGSFALQQGVLVFAQLLGLAALYTVCYMAAESLSRRAFPHHVQLWRAWATDVAASTRLLGTTFAGYLLVPMFWAYEVALYFATSRGLGWYNPSDSLFQPDQLASYFPWLNPIGISLQAGFWEESLFRGVPLAGAALLGRRFGRRGWWIGGALLVEALCFGAGHATYPAQPAYARLVELIFPAVVWGLIYLAFGLLPVILMHFAFDVSAIGLPIFVSSAPGAWVNKVMIVALTLIPLGVVVVARWRAGAWRRVPEEALNGAWTPPPAAAEAAPEPTPAAPGTLSPTMRRAILAAGIVGFATWAALTPRHSDAPPLDVPRTTALETARHELAARGVELPAPWRELATVRAEVDQEVRYVWQEAGEDAYRSLLGSYLPGPHWTVRFARFRGDVAERAEEYQVAVAPDGGAYRLLHTLPEARAGASLGEAEARQRALAEIADRFGLDAGQLEELSAVPEKRPQRTDWTFTFKDPSRLTGVEGEARVVVELAGDAVADSHREVHVPEEWERRERDAATARLAVQIFSWVLVAVGMLAGVVGAIVSWSRKRFSVRTFLLFLAALATLDLLALINSWPQVVFGFSTAQPFTLQMWLVVGVGAVVTVLGAAAVALVVGFLQAWARTGEGAGVPAPRRRRLAVGVCLGLAAAGLAAAATAVAPSTAPRWGNLLAAGHRLPLFTAGVAPLAQLVQVGTLVLLLYAALDRLTGAWSRRRPLAAAAFLVAGLAFAGTSLESLPAWLLGGLASGLLLLAAYVLVLRFDLAPLPLTVATVAALSGLENGLLRPYPGAFPATLLGAVLLLVAGVWWSDRLSSRPDGADAAP